MFSSPINQTAMQLRNPYEFEPDTPRDFERPQTSFEDFMRSQGVMPGSESRTTHAMLPKSVRYRKPTPMSMDLAVEMDKDMSQNKISRLPRCESSPSVLPVEPSSEGGVPSWSSQSSRYEFGDRSSPFEPSRQSVDDIEGRGRTPVQENNIPPPARRVPYETAQWTRPHSQSRLPHYDAYENTLSDTFRHKQNFSRPDKRELKNILEREEVKPFPSPQDRQARFTPSKVRSRSPMKKMFGDRGWLGKSPEEAMKPPSMKAEGGVPNREESPSRQKKTSIMDKIRNKLDEMVGYLVTPL